MTGIQDLPLEILTHILGLIPLDFFDQEWLSVCKKWHKAAVKIYYSEVAIKPVNSHILKEAISKLSQTEEDIGYLKYGRYVQKLSLFLPSGFQEEEHSEDISALTSQEIQILFSAVPNLKVLDLSGIDELHNYLEVLESSNTGLDQLEEIILANEAMYYPAYYNHRASLKKMNMYNGDQDRIFKGVSMIQRLEEFPNLEHLVFIDAGIQDGDMTITKILLSCPKLVFLKFDSAYSINRSKAASQLSQCIAKINHQTNLYPEIITRKHLSLADPTVFNRRSFCSNLGDLSIVIPNLLGPYMECIGFCLPSHMTRINIECNRVGFYRWVKQVGIDAAYTFCKRISSAKSIYLKFEERINPIEDHTYNTLKVDFRKREKRDWYYRLADALRGDRKWLCKLRFDYHETRSVPSQCSFQFNGDIKEVLLHYRLESYYDFKTLPSNTDGVRAMDNFDSFYLLYQEDGNSAIPVHDVFFDIQQPISHGRKFPYKLLQGVIESCPKLLHFRVECDEAFGAPLEIELGSYTYNQNPSLPESLWWNIFDLDMSTLLITHNDSLDIDNKEMWSLLALIIPNTKKIAWRSGYYHGSLTEQLNLFPKPSKHKTINLSGFQIMSRVSFNLSSLFSYFVVHQEFHPNTSFVVELLHNRDSKDNEYYLVQSVSSTDDEELCGYGYGYTTTSYDTIRLQDDSPERQSHFSIQLILDHNLEWLTLTIDSAVAFQMHRGKVISLIQGNYTHATIGLYDDDDESFEYKEFDNEK